MGHVAPHPTAQRLVYAAAAAGVGGGSLLGVLTLQIASRYGPDFATGGPLQDRSQAQFYLLEAVGGVGLEYGGLLVYGWSAAIALVGCAAAMALAIPRRAWAWPPRLLVLGAGGWWLVGATALLWKTLLPPVPWITTSADGVSTETMVAIRLSNAAVQALVTAVVALPVVLSLAWLLAWVLVRDRFRRAVSER